MTTIELFNQFLLENDAFEDMVRALRERKNLGLRQYLNKHPHDPEELINDAFMWGGTREKWDTESANFWMDMDSKWRLYLKEQQTKK